MKLIINILILVVLMIGVLIGGFYVWENHQKIERQYQACLKMCKLLPELYDLCEMGCNQEYGK